MSGKSDGLEAVLAVLPKLPVGPDTPRCPVELSAKSMKEAADFELRVVAMGWASENPQANAYARRVIAGYRKFLAAFKAGDMAAALGHFAAMHEADRSLRALHDALLFERDLKQAEGSRANSRCSRGGPERAADIRELFEQKTAASPKAAPQTIKADIERKLKISRSTVNRALKVPPTQ